MYRALTFDLVTLCYTVTFASNICFTPLLLKYVLFIFGLILISPRNIIYYQIIGTFYCLIAKLNNLKSKGRENTIIIVLCDGVTIIFFF